LGCAGSLIPRSPKYKQYRDIDETLRSENFYKICRREIERMEGKLRLKESQ